MRFRAPIPIAVPVESGACDIRVTAKSRMDEATFREFYKEIAPRLHTYIRKACGDAALADDLLQEAFYRFLRADLPPLEQWQSKAYLYRAASSLAADHWRHIRREKLWRFESFFGKEEPANESSHEGEAMGIFRRLKPQDQTLLWLAYVEGFDHREIALALRLKEKSVRVLLFRAREKLSDALQKGGFGAF